MFSTKVFIGFIAVATALAALAQEPGFIWDKLETSTELKWTDCYTQPLQCARFQVPLNYSDPEGRSASIAMIRFPSPLAGTEQYMGPVLLNPGGPGSSGVDLLAEAGAVFSQILGPNFDIVSFDPRGVAFSTPRASFFPTEAQRQFFVSSSFDDVNATSDGVARMWARAQILGALVTRQDQKDHLIEHLNTENTARDMLRMVEAHGQEKLQYWGFSYGTVLGATFASLFPDRVGRLILDGVVDSENYYAARWSDTLDTDKTLQTFFDSCFEAGPDLCPFYESSAQAIARKLDELTRTIALRPIPVITNTSYGLVDYARLRVTIFNSLYAPYVYFPPLAQGLADLVRGNGTALYQMLDTPLFDCNCGTPVPLPTITDAIFAIRCTDGQEVRDTVDDAEDYVRQLLRLSQWGELLAIARVSCAAWPRQQNKHFRGPLVGNTSHPILWIGNTADPVTPIASAHKMARGYPGSVVLTQDSPGHTTLAAPSICTVQHIQSYLLNGTLPAEGVVCPVTGPIFSASQPSNDTTRGLAGRQEADQDIIRALERLRQSFKLRPLF